MSGSVVGPSRRAVLGAGAAAAAALTSGCALSAGAASTRNTITVMGSAGEHPQADLDDFTKTTGIGVEFVPYSYDRFVAASAAGNPPDVVRGQGGTDAAFLHRKQLAEPLDPYIAASTAVRAEDLSPINDIWRFDGTTQGKGDLLGLCKDYSSDFAMWLNTAHAPDVAAGTVLTYDDLQRISADGAEITGGRVKTYGWDFYDNTKPHIQWINAVVRTTGQEIFREDLAHVDLTSEAAVQALDWLRTQIERKQTISATNKSSVGPGDLFTGGRLASYQCGYWIQGTMGELDAELAAKIRMLPAPMLGSERVSPVLAGSGLFISAASRKKEKAWAFMEHFFAGPPAKARAASGWGVPSLESLKPLMPTKTAINKMAKEVQSGEDAYFSVLRFTPYAKIEAINSATSTALSDDIRDGLSTSRIAEHLTTLINDMLERGKDG